MEDIPPELARRLQVEELWARRNVLAESMNARRRERFLAIYVLARTDTDSDPAAPTDEPFPEGVAAAPPLTRPNLAPAVGLPAQPAAANRARKYLARGAWGLAGAAALLAVLGVWNSPLAQAYVSRFAITMPSAMASLPHPAVLSPIPQKPQAAVQKIDLPNLRAQVSAEIAAAVKGQKPVQPAAENSSAN